MCGRAIVLLDRWRVLEGCHKFLKVRIVAKGFQIVVGHQAIGAGVSAGDGFM
jgi:hypothetical protein